MKIERKKKREYIPITIELETEDDYDGLRTVFLDCLQLRCNRANGYVAKKDNIYWWLQSLDALDKNSI